MLNRIERKFFFQDPEKYVRMMKKIRDEYDKNENKNLYYHKNPDVSQNSNKSFSKDVIIYFHLLKCY